MSPGELSDKNKATQNCPSPFAKPFTLRKGRRLGTELRSPCLPRTCSNWVYTRAFVQSIPHRDNQLFIKWTNSLPLSPQDNA